ncbi:glycosyltransferase family 2 protein [Sphingomonas jeddahensis]|uniref:glycosyltransferase family 2 protein n=1 Tax=Sphingomonas jeddahensis TaxID=1915074 RepID=UPI001E364921|nr:glycosyltransferase [Sphingomonas jeddahensis]
MITLVIILVGLIQVLFNLVQLVFAGVALHERPPLSSTSVLWQRYSELAPPIALIAPAYNEELTIIASVDALLALHYPDFEVVVINDGSKDATLQRLIDHYRLVPVQRYHDQALESKPLRGLYAADDVPRLLVIDKVNGGKADAMNAGINLARSPLVCVIDADTLLEPDALIRVVRPFVDDPVRTIAVGGTIRIANGCHVDGGRVIRAGLPRNLLALVQVVEYLRAFLMARLGLSRMGTLMIISGAFGVFRRGAVLDVGGFSHNTVGEDMELVVKLHRHMREQKRPYRIAYIPEPVSWTEAPESLKILGNQRARWQRGALETFRKHFDMFLNPKYGRIGFVGFGQILIVDVLGPLVEVAGYALVPPLWLLGLISFDYLLAFVALVFTFGVFVSVASLVLEEVQLRRLPRARDLALLTLVAVFENFGYRQLNNFWRLRGWWQFARKKQGWGTMTRKGFQRS